MNGRLMLLFKCFIKPFEGLHVIIATLFDWIIKKGIDNRMIGS